MDWYALVILIVSSPLAALLATWAVKAVATAYSLEVERWDGMVTLAFNAAEKVAEATGKQKVAEALRVFETIYTQYHGKTPSEKDMKDAALDLARKAFELKFSAVAVKP